MAHSISRGLIKGGGLKPPIDEDGLTGVTSNPTIFAKAIGDTPNYDEAVERVLRLNLEVTNRVLAEWLMVEHPDGGWAASTRLITGPEGPTGPEPGSLARVRRRYRRNHCGSATSWFEAARPNVIIRVPATAAAFRRLRR